MAILGSLTGALFGKANKGGVPKPIDYSAAFARERGYLADPMSSPEMKAADRMITDASATATSDLSRRLADAAARTGGGARSGSFLKGVAQAQNEVGQQAVDQRRQALMQTIAAIQARIAQLRTLQAGGAQNYQSIMAQMELGKYQPAVDMTQSWKNAADTVSSFYSMSK